MKLNFEAAMLVSRDLIDRERFELNFSVFLTSFDTLIFCQMFPEFQFKPPFTERKFKNENVKKLLFFIKFESFFRFTICERRMIVIF